MALKSKELPSTSSGNRPDPLEPGTYPARVVQIITLGTQPQNPWKGKDKPPALELLVTYELLDEFMKDEDGNDLEDKPRWISERFPLYNLGADLAKSTKRYLALDPTQEYEGDWGELAGTPCMVTINTKENNGRVYENVTAISAMRPREAAKAPELVNDPVVFDHEDPDVDTLARIPNWVREIMKKAVDYKGSDLEDAMDNLPEPEEKEEVVKEKAKPVKKTTRKTTTLVKPKVEDDDDNDDWGDEE